MSVDQYLARLSPSHKRVLAIGLLAGGSGGVCIIRNVLKACRDQQKLLCAGVDKTNPKRKTSAAVDKVFLQRLLRILRICLPGVFSRESALVALQGGLLVSRTLLTLKISSIEGSAAQSITSLEFEKYWRAIMNLTSAGVPAAIVNAGLKYMQKRIQLAFQERVTIHLHKNYCRNRAYYAASTLGGLTNADQRITEDVEKFALSISELYDRTFKPLLDVILFMRALGPVMGYGGQICLYAYFLLTGMALKAMSPPLALMTAEESALTGSFRAAHQRVVTWSEEIAVNDPPGGTAEQMILNEHLSKLTRYNQLAAFLRFAQKVADDFFIKYLASSVSLLVYGAPLYMRRNSKTSRASATSQYIRSVRLLQNTSRGIGDLILVYKRVASLAGHTSRVAELLEQVEHLGSEDTEHKTLFQTINSGVTSLHESAGASYNDDDRMGLPPAIRSFGDVIKFERVAIDAPDGTPLLRELSFEVLPGQSVMLMGPNGSGKSSLLRVLAGLWPAVGGSITSPARRDIFYLSQRPYVATGNLRDQILYPDPPRKTWAKASRDDRRCFARAKGRAPREPNDAALLECLQIVELEYLLDRGRGWDQQQKWEETLSGGERQRLAMARLLYYRPAFAVLDEATSAVSADGEKKLYEACKSYGITMLSIGHRPSLKQFHSLIVHVNEGLSENGWSIEHV